MKKLMLPIALIACLTINTDASTASEIVGKAATEATEAVAAKVGKINKFFGKVKGKLTGENIKQTAQDLKADAEKAAGEVKKFGIAHKEGLIAGASGLAVGATAVEVGMSKDRSRKVAVKETPREVVASNVSAPKISTTTSSVVQGRGSDSGVATISKRAPSPASKAPQSPNPGKTITRGRASLSNVD